MNFYGLENWIEINESWWECKAKVIEIKDDGAALRAVFYYKNNKQFMPPRNYYTPLEFTPSPTQESCKIDRQWQSLIKILLEEHPFNRIYLPPNVVDVRPFSWAGYLSEVKYTYCVPLGDAPLNPTRTVRRLIRRCKEQNYRIEQTEDISYIIKCIEDTEKRQNFSYNLTPDMLKLAQKTLGPDAFRIYVCFNEQNEVCASRILLHSPNCIAQDWVAGTMREELTTGVTQLMMEHSIEEARKLGSPRIDLCGANIEGVARAKSNFNATLTPYYIITDFSTFMKSAVRQRLRGFGI